MFWNRWSRSLRIRFLKEHAAAVYATYIAVRAQYNCGEKVFRNISTEGARLRNEFNSIMDKLQRLDPACPPTRL